MRIKNLKICNFRNHAATIIDTAKKITLIMGPNGSGKSSIVHGLSFILTGGNECINKNRAYIDELVTFGESRAVLSADIENVGILTRTIPHSFQVADWEGTMTSQEEQLYTTLGCTKEQALCTIYSGKFLDMEPNAQKNFMFNLIGLKLTNERVQEEFTNWCGENSIENPETIWERLANNYDFNEKPEEFDRLLEYFKTIRKRIKKEISALETSAKPTTSTLPAGVTLEHRESIIEQLGKLRKERDELMIMLGKNRNTKSLILTFESKLENHKDLVVPKETQEELKAEVEKLRKSYNGISKDITTLDNSYSANVRTINKLQEFDGTCALSDRIKCQLTKKDIDELILALRKENDVLQSKIGEKTEEKKIIESNISKVQIIVENRTKADIILPELDNAKQQLEGLKKQEVLNVGDMEVNVQELDTRIAKGQSILTTLEVQKQIVTTQIDAQRNLDIKKSELEASNIFVEAFGPKGIKTLMLAKAVKPIEQKVNERMKLLTDDRYTIRFCIDDNYDIFITSNGLERRVRHLSSSEKWRVGIVLQDAISQLSGLKLLVIDDIEMLDDDNKKLFWNMINEIKPEYESIILIMTGKTDINRQPPADMNLYQFS